MKNSVKLKTMRSIAGIIAIIAVIGFSFAACGGGGGEGGGSGTSATYTGYDANGKPYKLVISKSANNSGNGGGDSKLINGDDDVWVGGDANNEGLIFKANGTMHLIEKNYGVWAIEGTGSWTTSGNNVLTVIGQKGTLIYSYTVSGNSLTLTDDKGETETLTKTTATVSGRSAVSPAPAENTDNVSVLSEIKLVIPPGNPGRAAYAPQSGDTYKLTFEDKTSTGTVTSIGTATLTLTPTGAKAEFTVTTSGSDGISKISGTITWTDGTITNATITLTTNTKPKAWTTPSTSGKLTVNGLSAHNGKYALAIAYKNSDKDFCLEAFQDGSGDAQGNFVLNFTEIKDSSAVLNVWKVDTKKDEFVSYSGNDSGLEVIIAVFGTNNMTGTMQNEGLVIDYTKIMQSAASGDVDVCQLTNQKFSGGKLTVTFTGILGGIGGW